MQKKVAELLLAAVLVILALSTIGVAEDLPPERINAQRPAFDASTERLLRYKPDGTDFVIENGPEFFNRPLYGGNTAFRADAGDKPECVLYLPGRGGNLRLGVKTAKGIKWLHDTQTIIARYRPGSMVYDISDPLLGKGSISVVMLAMYDIEGVIVEIQPREISEPMELIWAFGGADGRKGSRNGDIGCEKEPVSQFFQLKPDACKDNHFILGDNTFALQGPRASIAGAVSEPTKLSLADANQWQDLAQLLNTSGKEVAFSVVVGQSQLKDKHPSYIMLRRTIEQQDSTAEKFTPEKLSNLFTVAENRRKAIAETIIVNTPDPFINAAGAALCVAADAIWDEKEGAVMHGAVAWRSKLLGWRGPYANDDLGRHDRSKRHLTYWVGQQDTSPVPDKILPADPTANLSRNEPSMHTSGVISKKHYDMNLVYIDTLFRHILWTGDKQLAEQVWPVIERHLAWERRLFRRPFGNGKYPLYEAYAAIWASDDLQYGGGGVTHTTAYNYYHNKMAATLATWLGKDPTPYQQEAELILNAMRSVLWLADWGWYGEYKDWLGLQRVHPAAGVYTFYHTLDSEATTAIEAWQMCRFVDTQIAHIPLHGPGVPDGGYFTVPSSNWMPYSWSVNNVVMAEAAHTSLAYWQAGRSDTAYQLFKGCILDSMYMGLCPGNVGMCTYFDMARGEAQRDFADGVGAVSRALIEGLFGITPDMPAGLLRVRPGFPAQWNSASLSHPDLTFAFERNGLTDTYTVILKNDRPLILCLQVIAQRECVAAVKVNSRPAQWKPVGDAVGLPRIEIQTPAAENYKVEIVWTGEPISQANVPAIAIKDDIFKADTGKAGLKKLVDPQKALAETDIKEKSLTGIAAGALGHRTIFAAVEQGDMKWLLPITFEIRPKYAIIPSDSQNQTHLAFRIQNNTSQAIHENAAILYGEHTEKAELHILPLGQSDELQLTATNILPGICRLTVKTDSGIVIDGEVTNWKLKTDSAVQWRTIDMAELFNDRLTQIFKKEYILPRSPFCSLAIPRQGFGGWCNFKETPEIDDSGLRTAAQKNGGRFVLPQGISFLTPGNSDAKNILFVSQWDNYPKDSFVPLEGKASHIYLLMAGSTNSMQCRIDNGEVIITYRDGSIERLILQNPTNWWPIDQDYYIDNYAFSRSGPIPPRVDLKTGNIRVLDVPTFIKKGDKIAGGAATVLDLPLDKDKELKSITVRALSNEVIIGLMAVTLAQ